MGKYTKRLAAICRENSISDVDEDCILDVAEDADARIAKLEAARGRLLDLVSAVAEWRKFQSDETEARLMAAYDALKAAETERDRLRDLWEAAKRVDAVQQLSGVLTHEQSAEVHAAYGALSAALAALEPKAKGEGEVMLEKLKKVLKAATKAEDDYRSLPHREKVLVWASTPARRAVARAELAARNATPKLIEMVEMCENVLRHSGRVHRRYSLAVGDECDTARGDCESALADLRRMAAEIEGE